MKKFLLSLICLVLVVGCTPVEEAGKYKKGTYFGHVNDTYGGAKAVATAVVVVNEKGNIESVFLDTTYEKDEILTTKKVLGTTYGMKGTSANIGKIPGGAEWNEQAKTLENKIVAEQGLDWLAWKDAEKTTTDSVSGVTMKIGALYEAVENALKEARK